MRRAMPASLGFVAWVVCGVESGAAQAPDRGASQLYQLTVQEGGAATTIRETERGAAYSLIEIDVTGSPAFTARIVILLKAVYDIARARDFEYALIVPVEPPSPNAGQGVAAKVFMTKDPRTPLQSLLGADYSPEAQRRFDREGWMSVATFAAVFEGRGGAADPLADLLGVYSFKPGGEPTHRVSKEGEGYVIASRTPDGWGTPLRLAVLTDAQRKEAAAQGLRISAGLRMDQGSADQNFDVLRVEETVPGSGGRTVTLYILFSWFGPDMLYKLPQ